MGLIFPHFYEENYHLGTTTYEKTNTPAISTNKDGGDNFRLVDYCFWM